MKATEILIEEHRVIERVLDALEPAANRLSSGDGVPAAFFLKAADFIKGFADGCHHHKEEGILFVALEANGMSREKGPVAVMLAEHEEARRLTRAMRAAAEQMQGGDPSAASQVVQNALSYVKLLRQHIQKEDRVLFPVADRAIPAEQREQVDAAFDRAGQEETAAGLREKYLALAAELEQAVAA